MKAVDQSGDRCNEPRVICSLHWSSSCGPDVGGI